MNQLLDALDQVPRQAWVIIGALLCSHAGTQWVKFYLPKDTSQAFKTHAPRVIAFTLAAAPVAVLWGGVWYESAFVAFLVGLWAPTFWLVAMRVLGVFAPRLRDALSIDAGGAK